MTLFATKLALAYRCLISFGPPQSASTASANHTSNCFLASACFRPAWISSSRLTTFLSSQIGNNVAHPNWLCKPKAGRQKTGKSLSNKLGLARHGHGRHRQRRVPVKVFGHQTLLRIECHLPRDFLSGVGGHAAHDRHHRAARHPFAIVDRLARSDGGQSAVQFRCCIHRLAYGVGDPLLALCLVTPKDFLDQNDDLPVR